VGPESTVAARPRLLGARCIRTVASRCLARVGHHSSRLLPCRDPRQWLRVRPIGDERPESLGPLRQSSSRPWHPRHRRRAASGPPDRGQRPQHGHRRRVPGGRRAVPVLWPCRPSPAARSSPRAEPARLLVGVEPAARRRLLVRWTVIRSPRRADPAASRKRRSTRATSNATAASTASQTTHPMCSPPRSAPSHVTHLPAAACTGPISSRSRGALAGRCSPSGEVSLLVTAAGPAPGHSELAAAGACRRGSRRITQKPGSQAASVMWTMVSNPKRS
jgi:hypothetical protein